MRILAIAGVTLRELITARSALVAVAVAALLLVAYHSVPVLGEETLRTLGESAAQPAQRGESARLLTFLSLALSMAPLVVFALCVLPPALSIPAEFDERNVALIFSKPVRRSSYLLGKFVGHGAHVLLVSSVYFALVWAVAMTSAPAGSPGPKNPIRAVEVRARGIERVAHVKGRAVRYVLSKSADEPAEVLYRFEAALPADGALAAGELRLPVYNLRGIPFAHEVEVRVLPGPGGKASWTSRYEISSGRRAAFRVSRRMLPETRSWWVSVRPVDAERCLAVSPEGVSFTGRRAGWAASLLVADALLVLKMFVVLAAVIAAAAHFTPLVNMVLALFVFVTSLLVDFYRVVLSTIRADMPGLFTSRDRIALRFEGGRVPRQYDTFFAKFSSTFRWLFEFVTDWFPDWWRVDAHGPVSSGYVARWDLLPDALAYYPVYVAALLAVAVAAFSVRQFD